MKKIINVQVVRGLPELSGCVPRICGDCAKGKMTRVSHPRLKVIPTESPLELLHVDLMGPIPVESIGRKKYAFVIVDDYTRFTWIRFLREKSEAAREWRILCKGLINEKGNIIKVRSDHGGEFIGELLEGVCEELRIHYQFFAPITP